MAISKETAKKYGTCTVIAAWLAVFCLFGYRSSFSIMQTSLVDGMGWTSTQASLGYCFMMTFYAITAFFSGSLIDKRGTKPTYIIGLLDVHHAGAGFLAHLLDQSCSDCCH